MRASKRSLNLRRSLPFPAFPTFALCVFALATLLSAQPRAPSVGMGPQPGAKKDTLFFWQNGKVIGSSIAEAGGAQTHFDVVPDGEVVRYFGNDPRKPVAMRMIYVKGKKISGTLYAPNGSKTLETGFENDMQHGIFKTFFPNGQVMDSCRKAHGRTEGWLVSYDEQGHPREKAEYRQGVKEGLDREYFPEGPVKSEIRYHQGRRDGPFTVWNPNGSPVTRGSYAADVPTGTWEEFHPNGQVRARTRIADWRIVERKCFTGEGRADMCQDDAEEWKALDGMKRAWERKIRLPPGARVRDPMPQAGPKAPQAPPNGPPLKIAPKP